MLAIGARRDRATRPRPRPASTSTSAASPPTPRSGARRSTRCAHSSRAARRLGRLDCRASSTSAAAFRPRVTRSVAAPPARRRPREAPPVDGTPMASAGRSSPASRRSDRSRRDTAGARAGRALYADAGIHLATVGNVKRQTEPEPLTWVETDSSDSYLPDVNLEHNRWLCLPVMNAAADATDHRRRHRPHLRARRDRPRRHLPAVEAGEVLAFLDTGAYQDAPRRTSTRSRARARRSSPAIEAELIRRHETLDDVFGRDLIPERLRREPETAASRTAGRPPASITSRSAAGTSTARSRSTAICWASRCGLGATPRAASSRSRGIAKPKVRWADLEMPQARYSS